MAINSLLVDVVVHWLICSQRLWEALDSAAHRWKMGGETLFNSFKMLNVQVGYNGGDKWPHSCSFCLLVDISFVHEIGVLSTQLMGWSDLSWVCLTTWGFVFLPLMTSPLAKWWIYTNCVTITIFIPNALHLMGWGIIGLISCSLNPALVSTFLNERQPFRFNWNWWRKFVKSSSSIPLVEIAITNCSKAHFTSPDNSPNSSPTQPHITQSLSTSNSSKIIQTDFF